MHSSGQRKWNFLGAQSLHKDRKCDLVNPIFIACKESVDLFTSSCTFID